MSIGIYDALIKERDALLKRLVALNNLLDFYDKSPEIKKEVSYQYRGKYKAIYDIITQHLVKSYHPISFQELFDIVNSSIPIKKPDLATILHKHPNFITEGRFKGWSLRKSEEP